MAVFLLGMFVPRANEPGVLIGLLCGGVSVVAAIVFTEVPKWWYGAFTVFPTFLVGAVASRWFPPPSSEIVSRSSWRAPTAAPRPLRP